ncbi:hypothetical protein [Streptomyces albus]|uniref:hypothetical protein n=1 Tax=Streptomyces albus TaxID=1888 RepID=UPI0024E18BB0|nr:hypothetical protein [Streptomyces albus]GHJ21662.1 hypothetical protein TPA0909_32760 [Streptomyces albus]
MKRHHKINHGWCPPSRDLRTPDAMSPRYEAELETARRKAERAWRQARKVAERAEQRAAQRPTPTTLADRDRARCLLLQRLDELRRIEELMHCAPVSKQAKLAQRTGRQERLEIGELRRSKSKRQPKMPVTTRRKP